ncbi:MAG: hypothetical protein ACRDRG_17750 [Pseudonocardiaceae bacterium]
MSLEGWDNLPRGYGANFDLRAAPWWLRLWAKTPFIDRFAYPQLVRRGHGYLTPFPDFPNAERDPVSSGWQLREADKYPAGSMVALRPRKQ